MKKLFLAVAAIATMTFSANAITGFTLDEEGTPGCTTGTTAVLNENIVTLDNGFTTSASASNGACFELKAVEATETFNISDVTFYLSGKSGTPFKIYPNYLRSNTSDKCYMKFATTAAATYTIVFDETNEYAGALPVTGATVSSINVTNTKGTGNTTTIVLEATGGEITVFLQNKTSLKSVVSGGTLAIGDVDADGNTVVSEAFYSVSGVQLPGIPESGAYILVETYDNGAVVSTKKIATIAKK